jgi:hypothetical protein
MNSSIAIMLALSAHLGFDEKYNNIHPHVRYTSENSYISGAYYNSNYRPSAYAGREFQFDVATVELGAATGYRSLPVVPFVRAKKGNWWVAPGYEVVSNKIGIVVGYEITFKEFGN